MSAHESLAHVIDAIEQTARFASSIDTELGRQFAAIAQRDEDLRTAIERIGGDVSLLIGEVRGMSKRISLLESRVGDHDLLLDLHARGNGAAK